MSFKLFILLKTLTLILTLNPTPNRNPCRGLLLKDQILTLNKSNNLNYLNNIEYYSKYYE